MFSANFGFSLANRSFIKSEKFNGSKFLLNKSKTNQSPGFNLVTTFSNAVLLTILHCD